MENYPAISILVQHGKFLAIAAAALPVIAALYGVGIFGMHWSVIGGGLVVGIVAGFLIKVVAELTIIITDMLLPK